MSYFKSLKSYIKSCSMLGAAAIVATGMMGNPVMAQDKFTLAHPMPPEHIFHPTSEHFMKALGSDFEVEYHPGGDLGDWSSLFEQVMQGAVPMTMTFAATDFDPRLNVFITGYIVDNWEDAKKLYGPGGKMISVYDEILDKLDLKLVGVLPVDFVGYAMRKGDGRLPVNLPEDAKGIKVRVPGLEVAIKRFELLGFNPVPMAFSELYTALQLGTVDGRTFGPPAEIWQMRDVLESYVYSRDYFEHAFWIVNKSWYEGLEDGKRAKLQGAIDSAVNWAWDEAKGISAQTLDKVKKHGINVVELDEAQLAKVKKIVYEQEWPAMEKIIGPELMNQIKDAAGVK